MSNTKLENSKEYMRQIHNLIPGGCHTYSKGDDQFPQNAPAAIKRGLGAYVWDIDENKYLDCSMGLTSVSLGHAYEPVLNAIKKELNNGVNFQRPSYLELEVAKKFLSLIPQHDMIKFSKNGSTITTAAVKLARAYTKREKVAFPKDHPFFSYDDWFISSTPCNLGTTKEAKLNSLTFDSKDLTSLELLFQKYPDQIACVISEPEKSWPQPENYLDQLISLCHDNGALYIQDEMVTGFKVDLPGAISKYKSNPDMATWGKGIANGFSFCALTGTKEVMQLGGINIPNQEKLFLTSTTHGGETHALAAVMATINEFQSKNVISHIHKIGKEIINKCNKLIQDYNLAEFIEVSQKPWQVHFNFKNNEKKPDLGFRTLFMQEMISNGVLFQGIFQPCLSHTETEVQVFLDGFNNALKTYQNALEKTLDQFLVGPTIKPVFRRII